ncbi:hypothetical protein V6Z11_D09G108900 [Gossypium hirsutum]
MKAKMKSHQMPEQLRLWQDQQHGWVEVFLVYVLRAERVMLVHHLFNSFPENGFYRDGGRGIWILKKLFLSKRNGQFWEEICS